MDQRVIRIDRHRDAEQNLHEGRSRRFRILAWSGFVLALVLVFLVAVAVTAVNLGRGYNDNVTRLPDQFQGIQDRPAPSGGMGAQTWILIGSDSRTVDSAGKWSAGAQRSDAIMVARVPADRKTIQVVSIPRDSWVPVRGYGYAKINAAYSWGGMPLLIETVEHLTDLRIDHVAVIDFSGFSRLTDALDGVTIPGAGRMDGAAALAYVRERKTLPRGDFDRIDRQQAWIRAVIAGMRQHWSIKDAPKLDRVLDTASRSIAVDDGVTGTDLRSLALSLRRSDTRFATIPVLRTGRSPDGKQAVVMLDKAAAQPVWDAMR